MHLYIQKRGEWVGPYTDVELQQWFRQGVVLANTPARTADGGTEGILSDFIDVGPAISSERIPAVSSDAGPSARLESFLYPAGRVGRLGFLLRQVLIYLVFTRLLLPLFVVHHTGFSLVFLLCCTLFLLYFSVVFAACRFHDFGKSGFWGLLMLVPWLGGLVGLALLFIPGHSVENSYGPAPGFF